LDNKLSGKSILFISPKTFGYEKLIIRKLIDLGANVIYFDDRPSESTFSKIVIRLFPFLLRPLILNYFKSLIINVKNQKIDYIFCIKQECFPKSLLETLFSDHPAAKKIFYTWDSFSNNKNAISNLECFDSSASFDNYDSERFGIKHRPLFYFDELSNNVGFSSPKRYEISFIGSVHMHRYKFIKRIIENMGPNYNSFIYLYVPSYFVYFMRKIFLFKYYGSSSKSEFKFKPLSRSKVRDVFLSSKAIIDFAHHNQNGLTMRSIEALGAKKKLITNNKAIMDYDFYNPKNILVLSDGEFEISHDFINSDYYDVSDDIYYRYSIEGWLNELFEF
jgi:hypothetical protein